MRRADVDAQPRLAPHAASDNTPVGTPAPASALFAQHVTAVLADVVRLLAALPRLLVDHVARAPALRHLRRNGVALLPQPDVLAAERGMSIHIGWLVRGRASGERTSFGAQSVVTGIVAEAE